MKQFAFITLLFSIILTFCNSCDNGQKPSERVNAWGDDTTKVETKGDKIFVSFQRKEGDLAEIQVSLNGVPFNVLWDTGCSTTSISALEFVKMLKEGKVQEEDRVGTINAMTANGSLVTEEVYEIRELFIAGQDNEHYLRVQNVEVAVADNLGAPMLLGQNVIQELPKHSFNDEKGIIEFDK